LRVRRRWLFGVITVGTLSAGTVGYQHTGGTPSPPTVEMLTPPPGVLNPDVSQASIATTICVPGWTATIRPPVSYTSKLKVQQIAARHLADSNPADYEEDHLIPLELGGHPTDPDNLWPQPRSGVHNSGAKDQLENRLKAQVCAGAVTLADAQAQIRNPASWP
jgi:hypothetical protein